MYELVEKINNQILGGKGYLTSIQDSKKKKKKKKKYKLTTTWNITVIKLKVNISSKTPWFLLFPSRISTKVVSSCKLRVFCWRQNVMMRFGSIPVLTFQAFFCNTNICTEIFSSVFIACVHWCSWNQDQTNIKTTEISFN